MNKFLQSLKAEISGVPVTVSGHECLVVALSQKELAALVIEAEREAKKQVSDMPGELTEKEREEIRSWLKQIDGKAPNKLRMSAYKTRTDYEILRQMMVEFSRLLLIEVLRTKEGEKMYSDKAERDEISRTLYGSQYAEEIEEAYKKANLQASEKKSSKV